MQAVWWMVQLPQELVCTSESVQCYQEVRKAYLQPDVVLLTVY